MAIGLIHKRMRDEALFPKSRVTIRKGASRLGIVSILTGTLLLSGCISPPKNKSSKLEVEMPNGWSSSDGAGAFDSQNWIRDFNDPVLAKIIEEALAHNYNLQAAASRMDSQIAGSRFAGSSIWPTINGTGNKSRNKRSSASGISQTPTSETFGLNARFNWEIDLWGKVRNGYKGDMADIQSAQADYQAARLSLAGRVAQSWYNAIEANQQYELAKRTLDALESSAVIVEENFKRGIARALDVRLVRANVASTQSTLETRLRQRDSSLRLLETLLGRYPANELKVAGASVSRDSIEASNQRLDREIAQLESELSDREDAVTRRLEQEQREKIPEQLRSDAEVAVETAESERTEVQKYLVSQFGDALNFDIQAAVNADPAFKAFRTRTLEAIKSKREQKKPVPGFAIASQLPEISGPVPAGLPSELLLRRPDVISAERSLAAAEQRKFETSKARIPSFNLTLSRGTSTRDLEQVTNFVDRRVWAQSFNIAQTLFQGGRLRNNYKRAKANYEVQVASYSNTVLMAFREVENALNNQSSFERDYEAQKIAAEESEAAEKLAWEEYGRGLSTITTALDAVRRNITAQRSFIQVSNQRVQSRIDLYLALGGGFGVDPIEASK